MNDRELLEAAAKAAGIDIKCFVDKVTDCDSPHYGIFAIQLGSTWNTWNPLEDDGDALRLAVRLNLRIRTNFNVSHADCFGDDRNIFTQYIEDDPLAATRRAIVCAAADVGVIHE
jgi:hypothetical protein